MEPDEFEQDLPERIPNVFDKPLPRKTHSQPATYVLVHQKTNRFYVGGTDDLYHRIQTHKGKLNIGAHSNPGMAETFTEDPHFDLRFRIVETKEAAHELEQKLLNRTFDDDNSLNIGRDVSNGRKGKIFTEEEKDKLREANREQFASQEQREKHREGVRHKWQDPAYREKQANRKPTDEVKSKISDTVKNLWADENFRKTQLEKTILNPARIEASRLAISTPIEIDGQRFPSVVDAAKTLGIKSATVRYRSLSKHFPNYVRLEKDSK